MSERARTQEQKGQNLNFVQIFRQKLESIQPLSEEESRKWMKHYGETGLVENFEEVGIVQTTKLAEGVIFVNRNHEINPDLEIWIEDQRDTDGHGEPHNVIANWLKSAYPSCVPVFSVSIILNNQSSSFLLVAPYEVESDDGIPTPSIEKWLQVIERYNIFKIIGIFETRTENEDPTVTHLRAENIIDRDLLGIIREERHIKAFAQKWRMTIKQLVEFRRKVLEAKNSTVPIRWAQIAETVTFK